MALLLRFGLFFCLILMGSCTDVPDYQEVQATRKSTREFYLQCIETVNRNAYGRNTFDLMQECRQAAIQIK